VTAPPAGTSGPDPDPDLRARVAWSLLAEPGDPTAGAVVAALGAARALAWVRWAVGVPPGEALQRLRALARAAGADRETDTAGDVARGGVPAPVPVAARVPGTVPAPGTDPVSVPIPVPVQDGLRPVPWPDGTARVLARALPRWAPRVVDLDPDRALADLDRVGGVPLVPGRPGWPRRLDDLGVEAPLCLWVRGDPRLDAATGRSVAVVGARAATAYGERVAADLGAGVAARGVTVVSGGAFGIDVAAHRGALAVDGPTVALLAGGIDRPSPAGNLPVLERLVEAGGALVAECAPGTVPSRSRFLQRNRLIAALAGATVVVEAAWRSGALSTAARATALLRPLGAVPGPVTSMASAGCHRLLRDGAAVCVTDADEVLELLGGLGAGVDGTDAIGATGADDGTGGGEGRGGSVGDAERRGTAPRRRGVPAPPDRPDRADRSDRSDRADSLAARVLDALPARRGTAVEDLARRAGLSEREVAGELGLLELAGTVRRVAGLWSRAPGDSRGP
jgi:DNA processing protein